MRHGELLTLYPGQVGLLGGALYHNLSVFIGIFCFGRRMVSRQENLHHGGVCCLIYPFREQSIPIFWDDELELIT